MVNPKVIALSLVYFGAVATNYGLGFFLPQIVKTFGLTTFMTTVVSAAPYAVGTIAMVLWALRSDRVARAALAHRRSRCSSLPRASPRRQCSTIPR